MKTFGTIINFFFLLIRRLREADNQGRCDLLDNNSYSYGRWFKQSLTCGGIMTKSMVLLRRNVLFVTKIFCTEVEQLTLEFTCRRSTALSMKHQSQKKICPVRLSKLPCVASRNHNIVLKPEPALSLKGLPQ